MKNFKKDKNRFLGSVFFLMLLSIMIFIIWRLVVWMGYITISLPFSQLIITGERYYTSDNDVRKSVLNIGSMGTFMRQDIRLIQKEIKNFPWIKQISVRKQWPNKIKIYIIEYVPVAYWNCSCVITRDAVLFNIPNQYMTQKVLPLLSGPEGSERYVLNNYYVFNNILQSSMFIIKSASVNHRYSWELVLQDGVKLILGRKNNIVRLERFIKVYPVFLKRYIKKKYEYISYVDLRYESGFAVRKIPIVQDND